MWFYFSLFAEKQHFTHNQSRLLENCYRNLTEWGWEADRGFLSAEVSQFCHNFITKKAYFGRKGLLIVVIDNQNRWFKPKVWKKKSNVNLRKIQTLKASCKFSTSHPSQNDFTYRIIWLKLSACKRKLRNYFIVFNWFGFDVIFFRLSGWKIRLFEIQHCEVISENYTWKTFHSRMSAAELFTFIMGFM